MILSFGCRFDVILGSEGKDGIKQLELLRELEAGMGVGLWHAELSAWAVEKRCEVLMRVDPTPTVGQIPALLEAVGKCGGSAFIRERCVSFS